MWGVAISFIGGMIIDAIVGAAILAIVAIRANDKTNSISNSIDGK